MDFPARSLSNAKPDHVLRIIPKFFSKIGTGHINSKGYVLTWNTKLKKGRCSI